MKKLLLMTFLAAGAMAPVAAQNFCILDKEGMPIDNGGVINYLEYTASASEYEDPSTGAITYLDNVWLIDPELKLYTETAGNYTIQVTSNITNLKLCTVLQAGEGGIGVCETGEKVLTKSPVEMLAEDERDLHLTYDETTRPYNPDATYDFPEINATIEVWNNENPTEVYSVTLNMGGFVGTAGVESLLDGGSSVVFAANTLSYDLASASNLNIYSLSGKVVVSKAISGNGSINLANLPKGIYVYKISGKINKTAKIVIR